MALILRWPFPEPSWIHVDEWVLIVLPLGFWGGDLNPHFFNYPTFHLYVVSGLYYLYFLLVGDSSAANFLAYRYFVEDHDLIAIARGVGSLFSTATVAVCALTARRLYGEVGGVVTGIFATVMLLPVRFAHLAITDNPALLWIALAILWAVRIVQDVRRSDYLVAGIFVGLATATKFPSVLVAVPVVVAALLVKPSLRQRGIWKISAAALATFFFTAPYVLLDWQTAWTFVEEMGKFHLFVNEASPDEPSWLYHIRHNLRHGLGLAGLLFVVGGLFWRINRFRREEIVLVAAFVPFFILLASAESVFMRYLLPLVPALALIAVRFLFVLQLKPSLLILVCIALIAEPAYSSWQTRVLLSSGDTRTQAMTWLRKNAPEASYLINLPSSFSNVQVLEPGYVYVRQKHFIKSFPVDALMDAYAWLAKQPNLESMYLSLNAEAVTEDLASDWENVQGKAMVLDYRHPILPTVALARPFQTRAPLDDDARVRELSRWITRFSPGRIEETPFDAVDWHFVPLGNFQASDYTGPEIRVGEIPLRRTVVKIRQDHFFQAVHGILQANVAMQQQEWERAIGIYESLQQLSVPLDEALNMDYLYDYYFNLGLAHHHLGRFSDAVNCWEENVALRPEVAKPYNNLGAAYFRLGNLPRAVEVWERAIALDPDYPEVYFNLGNALFAQQSYARAALSWKKAIDLKPDYGDAYYGLGNISYQLGQWDKAISAYTTARQFSPEDANIHFNMAQVHLRRDDAEAAVRSFERVAQLKPDDAEALVYLGRLYAELGRSSDARRVFRQLLEVSPNHPQAGEIRRALGDG